MSDPVYEKWGNWYFCDEVWANSCGPFSTREKASKACDIYAKGLDNIELTKEEKNFDWEGATWDNESMG